MEISMSPIWRDRILDLVRFVSVILEFYTVWLVNSGDWEKYNIPLIITVFMIICMVLTILLGEQVRSQDPKLKELEAEYQKLKRRENND